MKRMRAAVPVLLFLVATVATTGTASPAPRAKHVILFVADGAGFNTFLATAMYEGTAGRSLLDDARWVRTAASTYALCDDAGDPSQAPPAQDRTLVYDPAAAWNVTADGDAHDGPMSLFAGYRWLRRAPDSANTATTIGTGIKTYPGGVNVDGAGRPIRDTLASLAKGRGMLAGVVSSVPWSHATPAALGGAHHVDRGAYAEIATEMLTSGVLDLIAGGGHPGYDEDGRALGNAAAHEYKWVGGKAVWDHLSGVRKLRPGDRIAGDEHGAARRATAEDVAALDRWRLVESREDIEALAAGAGNVPLPLLMMPRVARTLQQERSAAQDPKAAPPDADPPLAGVPTLESMTRAALHVLDDAPAGFYLMVEGGAVDWAMHDNQLGRTIEEMRDFLRAVDAAVEWVERGSGWDETLVIVTADHDHMLWGPDAGTKPFDPLQDRGKGHVPGHRWLSTSHSASLVPVLARGAGAERLPELVRGTDPVRGPYVDQADIFRMITAVWGGVP